MAQLDQIKPGMQVVGNDGESIGVVDGLEDGAELRISRSTSDRTPHFLPIETVERVDDRVHLNRTSIRAMAEWR